MRKQKRHSCCLKTQLLRYYFRYFITDLLMFICSSLNQRLSKVIITCVYEILYASIMNEIYEPAFQMQVNTLNL